MSLKRLLPIVLLMICLAGLTGAMALRSSSSPGGSDSAIREPNQLESQELSTSEIRKIRADFSKAEREQIRELERIQKRNEKESRAARKQRMSDWESDERTARRRFFAENKQGPQRREYIRDFVARRKALLSALKAEERQEKQEHQVRLQSLKQDQQGRRQELENFLKEKRRPPENLLKP